MALYARARQLVDVREDHLREAGDVGGRDPVAHEDLGLVLPGDPGAHAVGHEQGLHRPPLAPRPAELVRGHEGRLGEGGAPTAGGIAHDVRKTEGEPDRALEDPFRGTADRVGVVLRDLGAEGGDGVLGHDGKRLTKVVEQLRGRAGERGLGGQGGGSVVHSEQFSGRESPATDAASSPRTVDHGGR